MDTLKKFPVFYIIGGDFNTDLNPVVGSVRETIVVEKA